MPSKQLANLLLTLAVALLLTYWGWRLYVALGLSLSDDLPDLGGADKIRALGVPVRTLLGFPGH